MERAADQSEQVLHQPVPEPALRSCRKIVIHLAAVRACGWSRGTNPAPTSPRSSKNPNKNNTIR